MLLLLFFKKSVNGCSKDFLSEIKKKKKKKKLIFCKFFMFPTKVVTKLL